GFLDQAPNIPCRVLRMCVQTDEPLSFLAKSTHGQVDASALNPLGIEDDFDARVTRGELAQDIRRAVRAAAISDHDETVELGGIVAQLGKELRDVLPLVEARNDDQDFAGIAAGIIFPGQAGVNMLAI